MSLRRRLSYVAAAVGRRRDHAGRGDLLLVVRAPAARPGRRRAQGAGRCDPAGQLRLAEPAAPGAAGQRRRAGAVLPGRRSADGNPDPARRRSTFPIDPRRGRSLPVTPAVPDRRAASAAATCACSCSPRPASSSTRASRSRSSWPGRSTASTTFCRTCGWSWCCCAPAAIGARRRARPPGRAPGAGPAGARSPRRPSTSPRPRTSRAASTSTPTTRSVSSRRASTRCSNACRARATSSTIRSAPSDSWSPTPPTSCARRSPACARTSRCCSSGTGSTRRTAAGCLRTWSSRPRS